MEKKNRGWIVLTILFLAASAWAIQLYLDDQTVFAIAVGVVALFLGGAAQASYKLRDVPDCLDLSGDGSFDGEIVGESFYQKELRSAAGPKSEDGHEFETVAVIATDDRNKHDKLAVRVTIAGKTVGHLSRDDARAFRQKYEGKAHVFRCKAIIVGGWKRGESEGSYGVKLDLPEYGDRRE